MEGRNTAQAKGRGEGVGGNAAPGWRRCRERREGEHTHPEREKKQKENARTFASKMVEDADRERLKEQIEERPDMRVGDKREEV